MNTLKPQTSTTANTPAKSSPKPRNVPSGKPPKGWRFMKVGERVVAGDAIVDIRFGPPEQPVPSAIIQHGASFYGTVVMNDVSDMEQLPFVRPIARATPAKTKRKSVKELGLIYAKKLVMSPIVSERQRGMIDGAWLGYVAGYKYAQRSARAEKGAK